MTLFEFIKKTLFVFQTYPKSKVIEKEKNAHTFKIQHNLCEWIYAKLITRWKIRIYRCIYTFFIDVDLLLMRTSIESAKCETNMERARYLLYFELNKIHKLAADFHQLWIGRLSLCFRYKFTSDTLRSQFSLTLSNDVIIVRDFRALLHP